MNDSSLTFYEFFAGGGLARLGLAGWTCIFANDFSRQKAAAYIANFGEDVFVEGDVGKLTPEQVPMGGMLAWASSPCQDLSLAGKRAGLGGSKSSAFWGFWDQIEALAERSSLPELLVVENVVGLLTSHNCADFVSLCAALRDAGYCYGAVEIDAALFVPQSRQRMFLVASRSRPPSNLQQSGPDGPFHTNRIRSAFSALPAELRADWIWWRVPEPKARDVTLQDVLEKSDDLPWHTPDQTDRLLFLMTADHRQRVHAAQRDRQPFVGTGFRRIRVLDKIKRQRAEVRFDGLAGCLRTPSGGSSSQFVIDVQTDHVRTRRLLPVEAARLMGAPDYVLPDAWTNSMRVFGDGVAVDVVRHLSEHLLKPLAVASGNMRGHPEWHRRAKIHSGN